MRARREVSTDADTTEKLQKVLAQAGLGSRREIERWIAAGRVAVNGAVAEVGSRVGARDRIRIDGRPVARRPAVPARVALLNKAEGVVCTRHDPEGRPTCFDDLPPLRGARWISVGRLDVTSTGLLLLSNDGALAHRLMHPSTGIDREYAVRVDRRLAPETERVLREGVLLDTHIARFSDIRHFGGSGRNQWYHVTLLEGRNREVRRLFESQHVQVSRLKRVRYGPVVLPSRVRRGHWIELNRDDTAALYRLVGLPVPPRAPDPPRSKRRRERSVLVPLATGGP